MDSDPRDVVKSLASSLQSVFRRHSYTARRRGWKALLSDRGRSEVDKLINNPSRSLSGFGMLNFREWWNSQEDHVS